MHIVWYGNSCSNSPSLPNKIIYSFRTRLYSVASNPNQLDPNVSSCLVYTFNCKMYGLRCLDSLMQIILNHLVVMHDAVDANTIHILCSRCILFDFISNIV